MNLHENSCMDVVMKHERANRYDKLLQIQVPFVLSEAIERAAFRELLGLPLPSSRFV